MSRLITNYNTSSPINRHRQTLSDSQIHLTNDEKEVLDGYILNLKIISNIKEYDKLTVVGQKLEIDTPNVLQGIWRRWNGQGRKESLDYIKQLINDIFTFTDKLLIIHQRNAIAKSITIGNTSGRFFKNIVRNSPNDSDDNDDNDDGKGTTDNDNGTTDNDNGTPLDEASLGFTESNSCVFSTIMIHLDEAIKGIQNLKITYLGDTSVNSELDLTIGKMYNRIEKIKKILVVHIK